VATIDFPDSLLARYDVEMGLKRAVRHAEA
jgi:hypothetical protein